MNEMLWTLIGLLAALSFGNLYWLSAKIDGTNGRIDGLGTRIHSLDERLTARLDAMNSRLEAHLEAHRG